MIFNLHLKVKLTRLDCKLLSFLLRETKEIYWNRRVILTHQLIFLL